MKVILLDDVTKVGRRGEVRDVSDGYARNFLIPKKLALSATAGNLKNLEHIKQQQDAKAERIKADAEALRARIEALAYEERRQASEEGKLFGSVTSQDIADFLGRQGVKIERRRIHARRADQDARRDRGLHAAASGRHRTAQGQRRPRVASRASRAVSRPPTSTRSRGSLVLCTAVHASSTGLSTVMSTDITTVPRAEFRLTRIGCHARGSSRMLSTCERTPMSPLELPSRIPPHNLDAERAVLGAILLEGRETLPRVVEVLRPSDFYTEAHRAIYQAMLSLFDRGEPVDLLTLQEELRRTDQLAARRRARRAGAAGRAGLGRRLPHLLRGDRARHGGAARADPDLDADHRAGLRGQGRRPDAGGRRRAPDLQPRRAAARGQRAPRRQHPQEHLRVHRAALRAQGARHRRRRPASRSSTTRPSGFQPSDFIIIAGRPSMGKTAFALNDRPARRDQAAREGARAEPRDVVAAARAAHALLGGEGRLAGGAHRAPAGVRTGIGSPRRPAGSARRRSSSTTAPGSRCSRSRAKARRMKAEHGLDLIVIDYLQLMRGRGQPRQPPAGDLRDLALAQGARQGAERPRRRALAALARGRDAQSRDIKPQLSRSSRERRARAGRGRHPVPLPAVVLQARTRGGGGAQHRRGHHRQAAQRPHRHGARWSSCRSTRASRTWPRTSTDSRAVLDPPPRRRRIMASCALQPSLKRLFVGSAAPDRAVPPRAARQVDGARGLRLRRAVLRRVRHRGDPARAGPGRRRSP